MHTRIDDRIENKHQSANGIVETEKDISILADILILNSIIVTD